MTMQFRRSGQRDDRRRRVLIDEPVDAASRQAKRARKRTKHAAAGKSYSDQARADRQPSVIDLLPTRPWKLAMLVLLALSLPPLLVALHAQLPAWSASLAADDLHGLDATQPASVATWLSSSVLLMAAAVSMQIYSIRRYKVDDYRGCYRVWLWAAALLVLASIDATASLHEVLNGWLLGTFSSSGIGANQPWWTIPAAVLLGAFAIRMLVEIRRSPSAVVALVAAGVSYGASATLMWRPLALPATTPLLVATAALTGHILLLITAWFYGRYVHLDAHGHLASAVQSKAGSGKSRQHAQSKGSGETSDKQPTPAAVRGADPDELTQLEEQLEQNTRSRKQRKARQNKSSSRHLLSMEDYESDEAGARRLSKAERKMLKKQRRGRRAA